MRGPGRRRFHTLERKDLTESGCIVIFAPSQHPQVPPLSRISECCSRGEGAGDGDIGWVAARKRRSQSSPSGERARIFPDCPHALVRRQLSSTRRRHYSPQHDQHFPQTSVFLRIAASLSSLREVSLGRYFPFSVHTLFHVRIISVCPHPMPWRRSTLPSSSRNESPS